MLPILRTFLVIYQVLEPIPGRRVHSLVCGGEDFSYFDRNLLRNPNESRFVESSYQQRLNWCVATTNPFPF